MIVETITPEDIERTNAKFDLWDNSPRDERLALLLRDPTIFSYAHFKDKQGNSWKMTPYQDKIINDRSLYVQFVAARQIGKTSMLCLKAIHHCFFVRNGCVVIVSRSEQQAIMVLDEIKSFMEGSHLNFKTHFGEVENRMELHLKNFYGTTSKIMCFPATEKGRGYAATLLLPDEVAFWEGPSKEKNQEYLYESIFIPTTMATKNLKHDFLTIGQTLCTPNPNGKQGVFWK